MTVATAKRPRASTRANAAALAAAAACPDDAETVDAPPALTPADLGPPTVRRRVKAAAAPPPPPLRDGGASSSGEEEEDEEDEEDEFGDAGDASTSSSDGGGGEGDDGFGGRSSSPTPPLADTKASAMARAFAKVMATGGPGGAGGVLASSKSVTKAAAADADAAAAAAAARTLRREMRRRGHAIVPRKGEDPVVDARERALARVATRGVVQLFNAVAAAQRTRAAADAARGLPGVRRAARTGAAERDAFLTALAGGVGSKAAAQPKKDAAWDVLADDFEARTGGGTRLRDWGGRDAAAAPGPVAERLDGSSDSESGEGVGGYDDDDDDDGEVGDPLAGGVAASEEEEVEEEGW